MGGEGVGPDSALLLVLLAVVLVGVLDGLSQGAIFADAAALPPQYTHVSEMQGVIPGVRVHPLHCLLRLLCSGLHTRQQSLGPTTVVHAQPDQQRASLIKRGFSGNLSCRDLVVQRGALVPGPGCWTVCSASQRVSGWEP